MMIFVFFISFTILLLWKIARVESIPFLSDIHIYHYESIEAEETELTSSLIWYFDYNKPNNVKFFQSVQSSKIYRAEKEFEIKEWIFYLYFSYVEALNNLLIDDKKNLNRKKSLFDKYNYADDFGSVKDFAKHERFFNSACRKYKNKKHDLIKCIEDEEIYSLLLPYALKMVYSVLKKDFNLLETIVYKIREITLDMNFSNLSLLRKITNKIKRKAGYYKKGNMYTNEDVFKAINLKLRDRHYFLLHRKYYLVYDYNTLILRIFETLKINNNYNKRKSTKDIKKVLINQLKHAFENLMERFKFNDYQGLEVSEYDYESKIYFLIIEKFSLSHLDKLVKILYFQNDVYFLDSTMSEKIIEMVEFASKTVNEYFKDLSNGSVFRENRTIVHIEYDKTHLILKNKEKQSKNLDNFIRKKDDRDRPVVEETNKDPRETGTKDIRFIGIKSEYTDQSGGTGRVKITDKAKIDSVEESNSDKRTICTVIDKIQVDDLAGCVTKKQRNRTIVPNNIKSKEGFFQITKIEEKNQTDALNNEENGLSKTKEFNDKHRYNLDKKDRKGKSNIYQVNTDQIIAIGNRGLRTILEEEGAS